MADQPAVRGHHIDRRLLVARDTSPTPRVILHRGICRNLAGVLQILAAPSVAAIWLESKVVLASFAKLLMKVSPRSGVDVSFVPC